MNLRRSYSLRQSRHILHKVNRWYCREGSKLSKGDLSRIEDQLEILDQALVSGERQAASDAARELERLANRHVKKGWLGDVREILIALVLAFLIAVVVRQCWWELYQIPTGSMRPTYREVDHLIVSKTALGINVPMVPGHLYFDPDLVKRTGVVIFTGHNIDLPNTEDLYFKFIPYQKRFIKRLIGKPGDQIYFYGGQLYGLDSEGKPIEDFRNNPDMALLEHIPFNRFEGRPEVVSEGGVRPSIYLRFFGQPLVKIQSLQPGKISGAIPLQQQWVPEGTHHFHEFLGIGNFAMARLLNREELEALHPTEAEGLPSTPLYLEMRHHPIVSEPQIVDLAHGRQSIQLPTSLAILPLEGHHIEALRHNLYTNRFIVENGYALRYGVETPPKGWSRPPYNRNLAAFPGVPDGRYELYYGEGEHIGSLAYPTPLPPDHPLLAKDPELVQLLFNVGIEFDKNFQPQEGLLTQLPSRYAYFRDGDFYVMGGKIMDKADPVLQSFVQKESSKDQGFLDAGAPSLETIQRWGVKVPEGQYLVLGDNHAFSADSRFFGFVPEENLRGAPTFVLWPPGSRWGFKTGPDGGPLNWGGLVVWGLVLGGGLAAYVYYRRRNSRPCFKRLYG